MDDTIYRNAEDCLFKQRVLIKEVQDLERRKLAKANIKSSWRARKERNECDVISFEEFEDDEVHPKEQRRVETVRRKFAQIYLNRGWQDYEALYNLQKNNVIIESTQNVEHNKMIRDTIDESLEKTSKFIVRLYTILVFIQYSNHIFHFLENAAFQVSSLHIQKENIFRSGKT